MEELHEACDVARLDVSQFGAGVGDAALDVEPIMLEEGEVSSMQLVIWRATHFKSPSLLLELLVAICLRELLEVLFHLGAERRIQGAEVGETGDAQVEVKNMVIWEGEHFA